MAEQKKWFARRAIAQVSMVFTSMIVFSSNGFFLRQTFHQIGKDAIRAERVGLIAEIVEDLQQALLAGGGS